MVSFLIKKDYTIKQLVEVQKTSSKITLFQRIPTSKFKIDFRLIDKEKQNLLEIEEHRKSILILHVMVKYLFSTLFLVLGIISKHYAMLFLGMFLYTFPTLSIKSTRKKYEKMFQNHAYKVFKFMSNQREAGVATSNVIKKLHQSVDDKRLKTRLISFAAEYIATNDYEFAFSQHLSKYYRGPELRLLDNALRQGLNVGEAYVISDDAENLLFEKYLAFIDYETDKKKTQTIFVAGFFVLSIVLLLGYPIVLDTLSAFNTLFSR